MKKILIISWIIFVCFLILVSRIEKTNEPEVIICVDIEEYVRADYKKLRQQ